MAPIRDLTNTKQRYQSLESNIGHYFYFTTCTVHLLLILYYDQQMHSYVYKLSYSYMFRHYRVVFRELVINTLTSYKSIANAVAGNTIYKQLLVIQFTIKVFQS